MRVWTCEDPGLTSHDHIAVGPRRLLKYWLPYNFGTMLCDSIKDGFDVFLVGPLEVSPVLFNLGFFHLLLILPHCLNSFQLIRIKAGVLLGHSLV